MTALRPDAALVAAAEAVADVAGRLSAAAMPAEISLGDEASCRRFLERDGIDVLALGEVNFRDARGYAIVMIEDRARRATGFREPRR